MTYMTYQGNDADCGFAALKMLMANRSKNKSYLYIRKPNKKRDYTIHDLNRIANKYGFVLLNYQMPRSDSIAIPPMTMALLSNNHMVYIHKVTKKRVIYYDPALGKISAKHEVFQRKWQGIVVECVNSKEAKDINLKKPRILPIWLDIVYYSIVAAMLASLMTGFYLIKDNSSILLTMGFLLLFTISQLVENWYIIKQLKLFDKHYLHDFFSLRLNQNMPSYKDYVDYRSNYFISLKVLVSNLVLIGAFSILLCLNDYRNIFVFVILLLVRLLDIILFSKGEKKEAKSIDKIEANAFRDPNKVAQSLEAANKKAYSLGLSKAFRKVVYMFLSICLAFGMMLFSHVTSTNFLIFHFGIYFLMSQSFEAILVYCSNSRERKIKKVRFLDRCDL